MAFLTINLFSGDIFLFTIEFHERKYTVRGEGQESTYEYAYPLFTLNLKKVVVERGALMVYRVDHRQVSPHRYPTHIPTGQYIFSNDIPQQFKMWDAILFSGIPYTNEDLFFKLYHVNDPAEREALHVSVRFNERAVVVNVQDKDIQ